MEALSLPIGIEVGCRVRRDPACPQDRWVKEDFQRHRNGPGTVTSVKLEGTRIPGYEGATVAIFVKWDASPAAVGYTCPPSHHSLLPVDAAAWIGVGSRVRRHPSQWKCGDLDGNGPGSVTEVKPGGIVRVMWDNGNTNDYRFRHLVTSVPNDVIMVNDPPTALSFADTSRFTDVDREGRHVKCNKQ